MPALTDIELAHEGVRLPALEARPVASGAPGPAVVLAAEAYGLNEFTRMVAGRLADAGYVVVVPDYYRGNGLREPDNYLDYTEVMSFIDDLDFAGATADILAAVDHARSLPEVDPDRVVVWGYCTGSTLAMLATALDRRLAAAVWFFPSQPTFTELTPKRPVNAIDLLWAIECPVLLIVGDRDEVLPAPAIDDVRRRFEQWGVEHRINIYPGAGHAFSAPVAPLRHDEADRRSWADALEFLDEALRA